MFFSDRIKNIKVTDKVLEIGPGATPYNRSDVFLELKYSSEEEYHTQLGYGGILKTNKELVHYDGGVFPFEDKSFDYIICSHVLEHVEDVELFMSEMFRVGSKGYIEYPLVYYEYLYNFDVHLNLLKYNNGLLYHMKKREFPFENFKPIQSFFLETLQKGHTKLIDDLIVLFMEGFEWEGSFELKKATSINELVHDNYNIPLGIVKSSYSTRFLIKQLLKKIIK